MEPDKDRITRMKSLGEALDRARSVAEELCAQLGAGKTGAPRTPPEPEAPAQPPPPDSRR